MFNVNVIYLNSENKLFSMYSIYKYIVQSLKI